MKEKDGYVAYPKKHLRQLFGYTSPLLEDDGVNIKKIVVRTFFLYLRT